VVKALNAGSPSTSPPTRSGFSQHLSSRAG
jgi:hypothetical protein